MAEIDSSILNADAKDYDVNNISNAYYNEYNDRRSTLRRFIEERKADIFLKKYCGVYLEDKPWIKEDGSVTKWTGVKTGNFDTGAITGLDANITLSVGDNVYGKTLTSTDLSALAQKYGDEAKLSSDGNTIVLGTSTIEKTAASVVPEEFINTYIATTNVAQNIRTGSRDWVVKATDKNDTVISGGADSIDAGAGDDFITVNTTGATVISGEGADTVKISTQVSDVTITDFNNQDTMTISGTFEVGSAKIEDMLLVITDKTGKRKLRLGDFEKAIGATVNIGTTSTTLANLLAGAGINLNDLEKTTYAKSVGVTDSSEQNSSDKLDDGHSKTIIGDPDYKPTATVNARSNDITSSSQEIPDRNSNATNGDIVAVNLDDLDTSQAGNVQVGGTIVGNLSSTYPNASHFTRNGLTIHLLGKLTDETVQKNISLEWSSDRPVNDSGESQIHYLTLNELTADQKTIIAGLFKWWANDCLTLDEDSYGISFNSDTAKIKDIGLYFYNDSGSDGNLAAVWSWGTGSEPGYATKLMLSINMHYYDGISTTDVDGTSSLESADFLDRTLAHEFVHSLMARRNLGL